MRISMSRMVYSNCQIATMERGRNPYGLIPDAALAVTDGMIEWIGEKDALPPCYDRYERVDLTGMTVTPGLIDCHTHIVFGGNRVNEFERRLQGADYQYIAKEGGGILSTMYATRAASDDELIQSSLPRLDALLAEGVCMVEVKSGYGLRVQDELKMMRVARRLAAMRPVQIVTSWLAAHAVPPEFDRRVDAFIEEVVIAGLHQAHAEGIIDAVDGFCDPIAFSPVQIARIFEVAKSLDLPIRLHTEQFANLGGAQMAACYGALSVDHLEFLDREGIRALSESDTVAVLLPGAYYTLRQSQAPPVQALRDANVPMAVATDGNPGSSPLFSILTAMNMACTLFRLTPEEALAGTTIEAARVLGLQDHYGTLSAGKRADFAVWDIRHPAELAYRIGFNPLKMRVTGSANAD